MPVIKFFLLYALNQGLQPNNPPKEVKYYGNFKLKFQRCPNILITQLEIIKVM